MELITITADKYFYVSDGSVIRSLQELPEALRHMSPATFAHHVNSEKNDFYNWVGKVFNRPHLARKIKNTRDKELMAKKVFIELFA